MECAVPHATTHILQGTGQATLLILTHGTWSGPELVLPLAAPLTGPLHGGAAAAAALPTPPPLPVRLLRQTTPRTTCGPRPESQQQQQQGGSLTAGMLGLTTGKVQVTGGTGMAQHLQVRMVWGNGAAAAVILCQPGVEGRSVRGRVMTDNHWLLVDMLVTHTLPGLDTE
jgi:hypothetical protein